MSIKMVSNKIISLSFLLAAITFLNFSCSENKNDEINGDWILADYSLDREFTTLYINDSLLIQNPFGIYKYELFVQHNETFHEVLYPFDSWITAGVITVKNDTLIFIKGIQSDTLRYIRFNPDLLDTDLTFSEYPIVISLPKKGDGYYWDFEKKWLSEDFFIGNLKNGNYSHYPEISSDSILIQIDDIFISLSELTNMIDRAKAKVDEFERDEIILSLYADAHTPNSFLEEIKNKVEANGLRTAKAYKDSADHKIYFKMLE